MASPRRFLRVCLAQINPTVGDFASNRETVLGALREARQKRAGLVVFPELATTGYPPEDLLFKQRFVSENLRVLREIASRTAGLLAVVGFVDRDPKGRLYNAAAAILNRKVLGVYRKNQLPNYGVFDEKRYFVSGTKNLILDLAGGVRIGFSICEDIWQRDHFVYSRAYAAGVSLHVNISASPYEIGKQRRRELLLKNLARKARMPVAYLNLVGGQDEIVFDGGSKVLSSRGDCLAEAKRFDEDLLFCDLPVSAPRTALDETNPEVQIVRSPANIFLKGSRILVRTSRRHPASSREEEVYRALILGTADYIRKNRFQKVLIGLSGGVDSALVAAIAVDALGSESVIGVTMPSPYTSPETLADAKRLAENLGIRCAEIPIHEIFSCYRTALKPVFEGSPEDIAEENLQARVRGNLLMALSNKFGYLVLTTGNKSEMATGYCTLYGDMAGGFAVIKDVPKTLVFKLAAYRNRLAPKPPIPPSILRRAPTAELRFNQKDQDTLPPYRILDKFLDAYVEKDASVGQIVRQGIPKALADQAARRVDRNEYKRRQAPPGIKITSKAFGRDRRMPITNRYGS